MGVHRTIGLQWRFGAAQFVCAAGAVALTAGGFIAMRYAGYGEAAALAVGALLGVVSSPE